MSPASAVPADPTQWSESSQKTLSAVFIKEYKDKHYQCWHCRAAAVFSAVDQKYTYEVRKANIDQQRILCEACWQRSLAISSELDTCQSAWVAAKAKLRTDAAFLARWLKLLEEQETYVPYKHDVARKNMLRKLIAASDA
jgi:Probable zinc-ribbon domain